LRSFQFSTPLAASSADVLAAAFSFIATQWTLDRSSMQYGVSNPRDPEENIRGGAKYLKDLLKRFNNDVKLALAAYNAGEGTVLRHGNKLPPYRETQGYVPQVLRHYQHYSGCGAYPCQALQ
jgi:soluble lytic murein transglycosylase-like protein